jgi:Arf-GAP with SH3 domain, ANK repeat and PH domain-containing protein
MCDRFWIVLDQGKLSEYSNWKQKLDLHMEPIDLRMASVRTARDADRRFCFEVITPHFKRIYQATSEEDMNHWITAINNALQSAVEGRGAQAPPQRLPNDSPGREMGSALTGKGSSHSGAYGGLARNDSNGLNRRITVGARPSYIRTNSNSYEENPSKLLDQVRSVDQGNTWCADCGSTSKVEWVSINLGIILCIECSGIHRSLGTHISKVRSLTLDTLSFTNDIVELLLLVGNRVSNMIWEAKLDRSQKLTPQSTREQRLHFITAKYAERAYVQPITTGLSHFATADETLLASIKKNDIQGVLYGIALRGNVNATDRSRGTHAVFLALAAADPAGPSSAAPPTPVSPNSSATSGAGATMPKAFPIAELLIQNGAEVPVQLPAIPLSTAARLYIEQRTAKTSGTGNGTGDTLGPLPTMTRGGSLFGSSGSLEKEPHSKLQKRGSAGSRFAGKVVSLARESQSTIL